MPAAKAPTLVWTRARGKEAKDAPFIAGKVYGQQTALGSSDSKVKVQYDDGSDMPTEFGSSDLLPRNPSGTRPDCCMLVHLNEACVLENIAARFAKGEIYTWTSHVLTAVNPFEAQPLYPTSLMGEFPALPPRDLPPHAFSVAELAVRNVPKGPQAVIVSGESGAGKTVSMAHVMTYSRDVPPALTLTIAASEHGSATFFCVLIPFSKLSATRRLCATTTHLALVSSSRSHLMLVGLA